MIPAGWDGFTATRHFRGVTYQIAVRREGPGNAVALTVDGQPVPGCVVPLADGPGPVDVQVVLS